MTILQIVAMYDSATEAYGRPVFVPSIAAAIRSFGDEINGNKESDVFKHPTDFSLMHIGEYHDDSGEIIPQFPARLARAQDLKETTS